MHVYFVRHGETELNVRHIHQSPNTPLSPYGRQYMESVGESLREANPDLVLTSEYTRTLESAEIIGASVGLTPQVQEFLYEIERPSKLFHTSVLSIETAWYIFLSIMRSGNASWRYADAENVTDIENRARKAIGHLESLVDTHASVIVVSHSVFITIMLSVMCVKRRLRPWDFIAIFFHVLKIRNGEVIHMMYDPHAPNACVWRRV